MNEKDFSAEEVQISLDDVIEASDHMADSFDEFWQRIAEMVDQMEKRMRDYQEAKKETW